MWIEASAERIIRLFLLVGIAVVAMLHPAVRSSAQPTIPMVIQGTAYVDGATAEEGTVVEARMGGQMVDSTTTETVSGEPGSYVLSFERESGEPVRFAIGGEEAFAFGEGGLVDRVPFDYGAYEYVLFVGEFPLERMYLPVIVGSGVIRRHSNRRHISAGRMRISVDWRSRTRSWATDIDTTGQAIEQGQVLTKAIEALEAIHKDG